MKLEKISGVYLYHWRKHHNPWPGFGVGPVGPKGTCRAAFYLRGILYKQNQRRHFLRLARVC
jgi:hypothetical protein